MSSFVSFSQSFLESLWTWILPSIFKVALIIAIAFFAKHSINIGISNLLRRLKLVRRAETIRQVISSSSNVVIIAIALMMILHELGFDIKPIIASAGLLGLAFSLGAQNIVKDVLNGFFILLEDRYTVGDTVKIGDLSGKVEKMNLRTTILKDTDGSIHIVPNSEISKVTVVRN